MSSIKILIVDTKEECERYTQDFKNFENIEVVGCANDGEGAVLKAVQTNPDLVVLDILLPYYDGFELFTKIKNELPKTKMIAVSSFNAPFYVNKAIKMGFDYFMIKPIETTVIAKRIVELFTKEDRQVQSVEKRIEEKITN